MGQSSGLVHGIKPVKEIITDLLNQYNESVSKL
jgi:hypothetical protein